MGGSVHSESSFRALYAPPASDLLYVTLIFALELELIC
jgi:hypothetical protein